jgi:hypothetical protein
MIFAPTPDSLENFDIVVEPRPLAEAGWHAETTQKRHQLCVYIEDHRDSVVMTARTVALDLGWSTKELCMHLLALLDREVIRCQSPSQTAPLHLKLQKGVAG